MFLHSCLAVIIELIGYFNYKYEHFAVINTTLGNIQKFMTSPLLRSENYVALNIRHFEKLQQDFHDMKRRINDYHTFFKCGYKYKQINTIHQLTKRLEFNFWIDFNNASAEAEYLESFMSAYDFYEMIADDFTAITSSYKDFTDKKTKRSAHEKHLDHKKSFNEGESKP